MKKKILLLTILANNFCQLFSQTVTAKLDEVVNAYVKMGKFTGTVLVAKKGVILLEKGYGLMDAESKKPNSSVTIYQLASLAKQFTAAIILRLQEQGKLSVHDKLSQYYPAYPNGEKISIHHLLSHSSGIFNYTDSREFMSADQSKEVSLDSMIRIFINKPLGFEPGTKFRYSNSGYTMLGYIIEKITGRSYRAVLESMILKPLKLSNTGYDYNTLKSNNKSTGYTQYSAAGYRPASYVHSSILYTTGALYSTVGDMYKWHKALMGESFLSGSSRELLYKPNIGGYAYGWSVDSMYNRKRVSHSGNVPGFKSIISRIAGDDICIIALSNANSSNPGMMAMALLAIVCDEPYELPYEKKGIKLDSAILDRYTGNYKFSEFSIRVSVENSRIYVQADKQPRFEILAEREDVFFLQEYDMRFEFKKDAASGNIDKLLFYRGKQAMEGKKQDL